MPSTMVHLITAYKVNPNFSSLFWVGSIAPDCIDEREIKDKIHFRGLLNREQALKGLAVITDSRNPFDEGVLVYLFLDLKWDNFAIKQYASNFNSDRWFLSYRNEIGLLSAWLYHNTCWSGEVWNAMINCDTSTYGKINGISPENISETIARAYKYHLDTKDAKPLFYTPKFIERFTSDVAEDYGAWRNEI